MINGIDVSQYQGQIDWPAVRQTQDFAFIRAITLSSWDGAGAVPKVDTTFQANWWNAKMVGMLAGPYAFARFDIDPTRFAHGFLDVISGVGYGSGFADLPPVIDVEAPPANTLYRTAHDKLSALDRRLWLSEVLDEVETVLDRKAIIYTGVWYWSTAMAGVDDFSDRHLWLARYRDSVTQLPELPDGWQRWSFWQWTSSGNTTGFPQVPGVPARVDLNVFDGTRADLYRL